MYVVHVSSKRFRFTLAPVSRCVSVRTHTHTPKLMIIQIQKRYSFYSILFYICFVLLSFRCDEFSFPFSASFTLHRPRALSLPLSVGVINLWDPGYLNFVSLSLLFRYLYQNAVCCVYTHIRHCVLGYINTICKNEFILFNSILFRSRCLRSIEIWVKMDVLHIR